MVRPGRTYGPARQYERPARPDELTRYVTPITNCASRGLTLSCRSVYKTSQTAYAKLPPLRVYSGCSSGWN